MTVKSIRIALVSFTFLIILYGCAELEKILKHAEDYGIDSGTVKDVLSNDEIIKGLKDALVHGTDTAVSRLMKPDGYFKDAALKILLPKEAQPIYAKVKDIPVIDGILDNAILSVNRAAEDAAVEAKPIFLSAIRNMTITDGLNILKGSDTAATHYLREKTYQSLYNAFKPKIEASLDKKYVGNISAEGTYMKAIDTYNTASLNGMLFEKIKNNSLAEHTARKALDGLFVKVAGEEALIRENPTHRVTDILKRVFGYKFN